MSKRTGRQGPEDTNEVAFRVVQQLTGQAPKSSESEELKPNVKAMAGKLGGLKGGKARAAKLIPEQRSDIARLAAAKRWAKQV